MFLGYPKDRTPGRLRICYFVFSLTCVWLLTFSVCAQEQQPRRDGDSAVSPSDLANDNVNRVAASEAQIVSVLNKNPGLLVELKRWVASDAAERGQLVDDRDLEDPAIFARLARELKFRAVATRLLQRYGYLVPETNPDSIVGREQDALVEQRVRQIVAAGQTDATPAARTQSRNNSSNNNSGTNQTDSSSRSPNGPSGNDSGQPSINSTTGARSRNPVTLRTSTDPGSDGFPMSPGAGATGFENADPQTFPTSLDTSSSGTSTDNRPRNSIAGGFGSPSDLSASMAPPANPPLASDMGAGQPSLGSSTMDSRDPRSSREPFARGEERTRRDSDIEAAEAEATMEAGPPPKPPHWSPYSDVPSVYDMFIHAVAPVGTVERFGEEVFRNAPEAEGTIPIDFPTSPDYVVGPGDGLTIDLWGSVSQRFSRTVDREGRVSLPEVGPILISGQTLSGAQESLQRILRTQFRDVSADVSLARLRTVRVYLVGNVEHPGAYDVSSLSTPLNALLAAGGPNADGSLRIVKHYRGTELVQEVDLYDLLLHGVRTDIKRLEPGDTLLVPPVEGQVRIEGMVRRPAIYELHDETNLKQAIDMAGGILPTAALSHIEVQRLEAHEKRTMLSLDISGTTDPDEIQTKLASFAVQDHDEIHIFPIATFNQDAVYLEGHVLRSGRYAYKPGMKLTDLIASYNDLLPEPASQYGEIIRLNAPDYHPTVESFDLGAVLSDAAAAPLLKPLDTVRIFSRFDFQNAPTVSVNGAVRKPGTFQTPGQVHLRDAVQLAGGVTPDAAMDAAQIIRIQPDSSLKILSVHLESALAGDPIANVILAPRDRVLIQQNVLHADPPSVLIGGEVVNPGRYALAGNLRVSDLVQVAGGLKRSADRETADLTEYATSNNAPLSATHVDVNLAAALSGDTKEDVSLRDGYVLTVRQVPGWDDLQAAIEVQGQVKHPGTYGIRPGERLSSILERAGGFDPDAYAYGAILERPQVRDLEAKEHDEMILRVKDAQNGLELLPDGDAKQKAAKEMAIQQWQSSLEEMNANPPVGRVTMRVSSAIARWKNTPSDIEVRAGDTLIIPKKPGYVMVSGQVFNPTAVAFRPGKSAKWYLAQAGGPTTLANKKAIFVIRADGAVTGGKTSMLWSGSSLDGSLQPGDTVVAPEKALSGNVQWQNILLSAQVATSIASTIFIALHY